MIHTIQDRAGLLINRYEKKYKSVLATPDWSKADLNELGKTLKRDVVAAIKQKTIVVERLRVLAQVAKSKG